jgi:superfamily I DNA and/or RNA helicase/very-short-patch-repair endonuclease
MNTLKGTRFNEGGRKVKANSKQIFEYLLAVKNLTSPPVQDFKKYEFSKYVNELPIGEGCYLYGEGNDSEAWLEVHKQHLETAPEPSPDLKVWLKSNYSNETIEPKVIDELEVPNTNHEMSDELFQIIKFEDDSNRVIIFEKWLKEWKKWAEETKHKKKVQELYSYFFILSQRMEREGETLDLAFGHGVLTWKLNDGIINHPVLITKMELNFNAKLGVSTIKPVEIGTVLETEVISNIDIPNRSHISRFKKSLEELGPNPKQKENIAPILKEFVHMLDPDGDYIEGSSIIKSTPVVLDQSIIFLRKHSGQYLKEDLLDAIEKINNGFKVPKTISSFIDIKDDITPLSENQVNSSWQSVGEDLLFPLASNEDQRDIARRLAKNYGIVVQGPPGTGKSHTIANLISHLLAHGKKVLVTSQKERPLRVLAEKIPDELRSLCVSVLGGDSKSLNEVEDSIRALTDKMSSLDVDILQKNIVYQNQQLKEIRKEIATLNFQLKDSAQKQITKILWNGFEISPLDAAKKLDETKEEYGWLPDSINIDQSQPLSDESLQRLWQLLGNLNYQEKEIMNQFLPAIDEVDNPHYLSQFLLKGQKLNQVATSVREMVEKYNVPSNRPFLDKGVKLLTDICSYNSIFETPYLQAILEDIFADGERKITWDEFKNYIQEQQKQVGKLTRKLSEFDVKVLKDIALPSLKQEASAIKAYLEKGKQINKIYLMTSGRKVKEFYENTTINNRKIMTVSDIDLVMDYLSLSELKERLFQKWNSTLSNVDGPTLKNEETRVLAKMENFLNEVEFVFQLNEKIRSFQQLAVTNLTIPQNIKWTDYKILKSLKQSVEAAFTKLELKEWERIYNSMIDKMKMHVSQNDSHSICALLLEALEQKNIDKWRLNFQQLKDLLTRKKEYMELFGYVFQLKKVAPIWANELVMKMGSKLLFPTNLKEAWDWSQLNNWLDQINSVDSEEVEKKIQDLQKQERDLIKSIVANRTWKSQLERITPSQRSALHAWKQKLKKIGAGTSKYVERYRKEARQEMKECRSAIPVWIMPVNRVIENFSISVDMFDVIIIDESSQCDLFSLPVLLRAKKAVVVGDDQQISPSAIGKDFEKVHGLIEHYLEGVPQAHTFELQTSLYDIARRVFPGSLMLKEHFRCAPEIIQFSNDLAYGGEIIPLRIPKQHERIDPPVMAKRVPGFRNEGSKEINEIEAEEIVKDIKEMISDPNFKGKTMGVITLLGDHQGPFIANLLRNEIGEEEIINHRIICGNAYDFQGDERDIIFISMVVGPNVRFNALSGDRFNQRFNVAASRAQNQMRLYYSICIEDLSPNDLRARLLSYCLNPSRVNEAFENLEEKCESPFEKDVLRMILARGYKVTPQVKAGHKRIDFVIDGLTDRLAVECDGDKFHPIEKWEEDMDRQRTLERVGWKFWRVRGSEFYRDREKAMKSLWSRLEELKITPNLTNQLNLVVRKEIKYV